MKRSCSPRLEELRIVQMQEADRAPKHGYFEDHVPYHDIGQVGVGGKINIRDQVWRRAWVVQSNGLEISR